jgi:hypothetical protein
MRTLRASSLHIRWVINFIELGGSIAAALEKSRPLQSRKPLQIHATADVYSFAYHGDCAYIYVQGNMASRLGLKPRGCLDGGNSGADKRV